jgi:hypothetical protein
MTTKVFVSFFYQNMSGRKYKKKKQAEVGKEFRSAIVMPRHMARSLVMEAQMLLFYYSSGILPAQEQN